MIGRSDVLDDEPRRHDGVYHISLLRDVRCDVVLPRRCDVRWIRVDGVGFPPEERGAVLTMMMIFRYYERD